MTTPFERTRERQDGDYVAPILREPSAVRGQDGNEAVETPEPPGRLGSEGSGPADQTS